MTPARIHLRLHFFCARRRLATAYDASSVLLITNIVTMDANTRQASARRDDDEIC